MKLLYIVLLFLFYNITYANDFTLDSSSFSNLGTLDATYTCDGKNITPELTWKNIPANTKSFALILSDPDAPGGVFYHWVIFNLPYTLTQLPKAISRLPGEAVTGKNSWGRAQYNGPCPPTGSIHQYIFRLYALNTSLDLTNDDDATTVINAMKNHIVGETELKTSYGH